LEKLNSIGFNVSPYNYGKYMILFVVMVGYPYI